MKSQHSEIINRITSKIVRCCDCFATDAIIRNLEEDNKKLQLKMATVKRRALFQRSNPNPNHNALTFNLQPNPNLNLKLAELACDECYDC